MRLPWSACIVALRISKKSSTFAADYSSAGGSGIFLSENQLNRIQQ